MRLRGGVANGVRQLLEISDLSEFAQLVGFAEDINLVGLFDCRFGGDFFFGFRPDCKAFVMGTGPVGGSSDILRRDGFEVKANVCEDGLAGPWAEIAIFLPGVRGEVTLENNNCLFGFVAVVAVGDKAFWSLFAKGAFEPPLDKFHGLPARSFIEIRRKEWNDFVGHWMILCLMSCLLMAGYTFTSQTL